MVSRSSDEDEKNATAGVQTSGPTACRRSLVALEVEGEVVGAREAAIAVHALERLGARVLAVVARQLVGAREPPLAALPRALVRLLTC